MENLHQSHWNNSSPNDGTKLITFRVPVIPPFLRGLGRRIYAAIFSFWAGVIPPLPMLGRSWL